MDQAFKLLSENWFPIAGLVALVFWAARLESRGQQNSRALRSVQAELDAHKVDDVAARREHEQKLEIFEKEIWIQFRMVQDTLGKMLSDLGWVRGRLGVIDKETR